MIWARGALAAGLLVLIAAFAIGTEHELSTSVMGQSQSCGPSISASWLVSGTPDQAQPGPAATACEPVIHESRVLIGTIMGAGGLLALVGWTATGTRGEALPRRVRARASGADGE